MVNKTRTTACSVTEVGHLRLDYCLATFAGDGHTGTVPERLGDSAISAPFRWRAGKTNNHQNTWHKLHWQIINTNYVKSVLNVLRVLNYEYCKTPGSYVAISLCLRWKLCGEIIDKLYNYEFVTPASLDIYVQKGVWWKQTCKHFAALIAFIHYSKMLHYNVCLPLPPNQYAGKKNVRLRKGPCNRLLCVHKW